MKFKKIIRKLINAFGYDVYPLAKKTCAKRTNIGESYALIRNLGFSPSTVIDIGVALGTPELYEAFSDSFLLLIDPLKEFEPAMMSVLKRYKGAYVLAAAGSSSGQATFNVHHNHLDGSSLLKESMGSSADGYQVSVPMVRVDDVVKTKNLKGPYLVKVDTQGAELDALNGAQQILLDTEVVVLEVSLFGFMRDAPQFYDVIFYMKEHGFVAYDIVLGWNRPLDNALGQVDIVFVKEHGMFRKQHFYSTVEK